MQLYYWSANVRHDVPVSSEKGVAATAEDRRRSHAKRTLPEGKKRKETNRNNDDSSSNNNDN